MGKHAIIVIKNKKNEYLQYYDEIWDSYLFLNCKLQNENIDTVKNEISTKLNIDNKNIDIKYVGKKEHSKYSESAKKEKDYIHYFYDVKINEELLLDEKKYKWFSYSDFLNNESIMKVNSDIVSFIKEFNL